ncbi:hypothetical protein JOQ06_026827 [Pogonophryne albipinna]|uniref:Uncharacterized protein n=1 Tax=Pogonophryne albipinna TaxID=1090488 RepID=A0AAD6BBQ6_9TELE|nr:hypothetical protein JOQ06_026827 [Pogonophryne albipinna]
MCNEGPTLRSSRPKPCPLGLEAEFTKNGAMNQQVVEPRTTKARGRATDCRGSEHDKCPCHRHRCGPCYSAFYRGVGGDLPHSNLGRGAGGGLMEWMTPPH